VSITKITGNNYSGHDTNCSWVKNRVPLLAYIKHHKDMHNEDSMILMIVCKNGNIAYSTDQY